MLIILNTAILIFLSAVAIYASKLAYRDCDRLVGETEAEENRNGYDIW